MSKRWYFCQRITYIGKSYIGLKSHLINQKPSRAINYEIPYLWLRNYLTHRLLEAGIVSWRSMIAFWTCLLTLV